MPLVYNTVLPPCDRGALVDAACGGVMRRPAAVEHDPDACAAKFPSDVPEVRVRLVVVVIFYHQQ